MRRRIAKTAALLAGGPLALPSPAGADWTAYHQGGALHAADRTSGRAAPVTTAWTITGLHGAVGGEPLVYRGLVIVATEADDVYAFRARAGARVWHGRLGHRCPPRRCPTETSPPPSASPARRSSTAARPPCTQPRTCGPARRPATPCSHWPPAQGGGQFAGSVAQPSIPLQLQRESLALDHGRVLIDDGGNDGDCAQCAQVCTSFGSDAYATGTRFVACTEGIHAVTVNATAHRFVRRWAGPSDADGPPILAAGRVWVTSSSDSLLYGLDPRTGAVRTRRRTPAMEHCSTPSASGGRLFLATGQTLNAYRIGTTAAPHR